ncbi:hypothetical protein LEM8419_03034 [Neolewinella maritima]|uniref:TonB C-terminal domain-containing protein n=1 Tax=Neolewinella maritima TaxID=1383882 RepID=A0ABN8FAX9_9BACT|nr:energy transducer TonB [Neolewinella maritima]CAH1002117.1 hypothetical protein LEM8419_03034 [Neolewinella maritima]
MKHLATLAFFLLILPLSAQQNTVLRVAEHMPLMLSTECPLDGPYPTRKLCSDRAMIDYIYTNVQYPAEASKLTGPPQMAVINFVVEPDGSITTIETYRDPGNGMGAEARRVVEQMAEETQWEAGSQEGQAVRVMMQVPIKFIKPE